ncbi:ketoacyl-ACP synthase III [Myxococcota bacterium]|nr:ketoacyl-ACP synthase III [Myxococcota bacterium]MBU1900609.1 ketoacyl-ACP synthase III [Myxococcota bacterium]
MDLNTHIAGVGRYLPKRVIDNETLAAELGVTPQAIFERSGVISRHRADAEETSSMMAARAAEEALADAGIEAKDLDLILNASGLPEQAIPDMAPLIQRHLGLSASGIPSFSIHSTCLSFLSAVEVASAFIQLGRFKRVLICSSEIPSAGLNRAEIKTAGLLGDAAAAVVLTPSPEGSASRIHSIGFSTYSEGAYLTQVPGGGTRLHPMKPEAKPEDGYFQMQGYAVLQMALRYGPEAFERIWPGLSRGLGDIEVAITHQPSAAGMEGFAHFFGRERLVVTLPKLGNCVAASIPATLYEAVSTGRLKRGQRALMVGTGAGLSIGGIVFTY